MVRQTLYNTVSSRDGLIELAILQRCEELKETLSTAALGDPDDIDEALLAFLMRAVTTTAAHAELSVLTAALPPARVEAFLGHAHPVEALIRETVRPVLDRALAAGRLRPGASVDEASRWIQVVLAFALLHEVADGEDPTELRRVLRTLALPSALIP